MYPYNIRRKMPTVEAQLNKGKQYNNEEMNNSGEEMNNSNANPNADMNNGSNYPENKDYNHDNYNNNNNNNNNNHSHSNMPVEPPAMNDDMQDGSVGNRYILELIKRAMADEAKDANFYDRLAKRVENSEISSLLHQIHHEEEKHYNILANIYYELTGKKPGNIEFEEEKIEDDFCNNFYNAMLDEIKAAKFYRKMMAAFLNIEIRDWFMEIMVDEQSHAQIMNFILCGCPENLRKM